MTLETNKYEVSDTIHAVPTHLIRVAPDNTRTYLEEKIAALLASMNAIKQQSPITIIPDPASPPGTQWYLPLIGNQRLLAAKLGGWKTINAIIVPSPATSKDALIARLAENQARTDLSVLEHVKRIVIVLDFCPSITSKALSDKTSYSEWQISTAKKIHACPVALAALADGRLTGWKDARSVALASEDQKTSLVERRASGETCDALRKTARKLKVTAEAPKLQRVVHPLSIGSAGTKVTVTGHGLTLDGYIAALQLAIDQAKKSRKELLDLPTAMAVWQQQMKSKPSQEGA